MEVARDLSQKFGNFFVMNLEINLIVLDEEVVI